MGLLLSELIAAVHVGQEDAPARPLPSPIDKFNVLSCSEQLHCMPGVLDVHVIALAVDAGVDKNSVVLKGSRLTQRIDTRGTAF